MDTHIHTPSYLQTPNSYIHKYLRLSSRNKPCLFGNSQTEFSDLKSEPFERFSIIPLTNTSSTFLRLESTTRYLESTVSAPRLNRLCPSVQPPLPLDSAASVPQLNRLCSSTQLPLPLGATALLLGATVLLLGATTSAPRRNLPCPLT